jgi:hypothetical protein
VKGESESAYKADLIATTREAIEQRLNELRPLVAEIGRVERALAALQAIEERPRPQRPRCGGALRVGRDARAGGGASVHARTSCWCSCTSD